MVSLLHSDKIQFMKSKFFVLFFFVIAIDYVNAQYATIYPTNWWVGMKHNKIQLLIKGEYDQFNKEQLRINYPGISVTKINQLDNGKYICADISIANTDAKSPANTRVFFINTDMSIN